MVYGPRPWADSWATRAGERIRGRDRAAYARRVEEAAREAAGLHAQLDDLAPDVGLLLVGTSGATRLASMWADDHHRLTVRVPAPRDGTAAAEALAIEIALAMAAAGRLVKALVCVTGPDDPAVDAFRARGLAVRPVLPLEPATEETEGEETTTLSTPV
jgi:hypothetical protein